jgi:hypothetical protein
MKSRIKLFLLIAAAALVAFFAVFGIIALIRSDPPHVYVVSPGIDIVEVTVFSCANIAFEDRRKAQKYSDEHPGTHVFEVSFKEIR